MSDQAEREQRIADTVMAIMQFVDTTIHENARDQMDEIEMGLSAAGSIAVTVIMNMGPCPCQAAGMLFQSLQMALKMRGVDSAVSIPSHGDAPERSVH